MTNESIFDIAKSVGAFATDFIGLIEDACGDTETGFRAGVLYRSLGRIEHHSAPRTLDLAEEAVFDGIPLRSVGRIVRDAHMQCETPGQFDHVLFEAQGAGGVGSAAVAQQYHLGGIRVQSY